MDSIYNLKEIQEKFLQYIYSNKKSAIINELHPKENIGIYRNSIFNAQIDALNTIFEATGDFLKQKSNELDLKYNLADIITIFVRNIPCQFDDYFDYSELFIEFLKEIELKPNIPYLTSIASLELQSQILLTKEVNEIPDYTILQNISNCDFDKLLISPPISYKLVTLEYDVFNLWSNYTYNKKFSSETINDNKTNIFIAPYENEITTIKLEENLAYLFRILNNKTISVLELSNIFVDENIFDFESCFLDAIQLKIIKLSYED